MIFRLLFPKRTASGCFLCVSCCVLSAAPSLSEQELFSGPLGGLDSGFNSVDSGSKRWSGNEVRTCCTLILT